MLDEFRLRFAVLWVVAALLEIRDQKRPTGMDRVSAGIFTEDETKNECMDEHPERSNHPRVSLILLWIHSSSTPSQQLRLLTRHEVRTTRILFKELVRIYRGAADAHFEVKMGSC